MFLKRIEVKGFKSFADKVELEFEKGITVVVGPNGSGKSNISDAVRWVLGEQSAKSLRGGKMEDVIFAGTDLRKPLGFAEVSITIDNSDGKLPVEYSEVTITRRMYRSGESEYYINKTSCRLKDITELFMDTGIGKDGYSIIGQGRIDEILNAKPEDRREIFEEAAGIVKYKSRKQESEKRLDTTEQNIIRIDDIINELEMQLEPLCEQSSSARKYLDLKEKLKIFELNIYIRNIDKIKEKLVSISENYSNLENHLIDNNRANAVIEEEYEKLKNLLHDMDAKIDSFQNEVYSKNNEIERLQGHINVLNEKALNIQSNIQKIEEEIGKEHQNIDKTEKILEEHKLNLSVIQNSFSKHNDELNDKSKDFEEVSNKISEKVESIEGMKTEVIELLNLISDKKSLLNGYTAFKNNIEKRRNQIYSEKDDNNIKINELAELLKNAEEEIKLNKSQYEDILIKISGLEKSKTHAAHELRLMEDSIFDLNGRIQSKQARYKILHEMELEFEGYNRSVKEIMKLKNIKSAQVKGICGVVAELIHVPEEYEVALEVALGSALQNIVTENELTAKDCIEYLKVNKYGRATFLPLTTIKARETSINNKNILAHKGFVGFAAELINFDSKYKNIINSLLGRVIVVDNIDHGIVIAKETNYSLKIVTLDGDVINPGGAFTGGSISQKTGKILSRKREIEQIENELQELQNTHRALTEKRDINKSNLESMESQIKQSIEERHSMELKISACESSYNQIRIDIQRIENNLQLLSNEFAQLEAEYNEVDGSFEKESEALLELENRNLEISSSLQTEQSNIKDITGYKEDLTSVITSLKVKIAEYRQEIISVETKINELTNNIVEYQLIINKKAEEKVNSIEESKTLDFNIKETEALIEVLSKKKCTLKEELDGLISNKKKSALMLDDIDKKKRELSESSAVIQGEMHKIDVLKTKHDMELESLQNKIWDDYEISYAAALRYKVELDNMSQTIKDINCIKEDIKNLGTVNVGAIEEYKRVKERYEFLQHQKSDLEDAKNSLKQVIVEMTEKMRALFIKNFAVIKENFNTTFQQLFGGGKAELVLCDEQNILDSGVEIIAQPPGKKLQHLTLLSGGEKALTAIALLFAILKMKPSPFCILDEIEAALDDVNVNRYAKFLKEFSRQTQFIVVTHRKGTMEVSDALYGVTMEEKGVSRIMSVKLSEKAS